MAYRDGLLERGVQALADLGSQLPLAEGREAVALTVSERYQKLFEADYCRFWWLSDDGVEARVVGHFPPREFEEPWEHVKRLDDPDKTVVTTIFDDPRPRVVADPTKVETVESRYASVYGAKSGAHIPMFLGDRTVGDMVLISLTEHGHFDPDDVKLLQALANYAAVAIASANRF